MARSAISMREVPFVSTEFRQFGLAVTLRAELRFSLKALRFTLAHGWKE
jgi:hypothetical protein